MDGVVVLYSVLRPNAVVAMLRGAKKSRLSQKVRYETEGPLHPDLNLGTANRRDERPHNRDRDR